MKELPTIQTDTRHGRALALIDEVEADRVAAMFKALGDPVRLRLTALIAAQDEICVCHLTPHFALSGPTISHHLKQLREAGLIDSERRGTWIYYRIRPDALHALGQILHPLADESRSWAGTAGQGRSSAPQTPGRGATLSRRKRQRQPLATSSQR